MRRPASRQDAIAGYRALLSRAIEEGIEHEVERELALSDLFFLLTSVLGRADLNRDWLFARCREVEANPNGYLDLWAREHYKSTIITFGKTIQDVLANPEETVCIFSFSRPTAKAFLRQIKREFESNERLRGLFPDVLWDNPQREAPKWSEDDGIVVRRRGNPKESTIEAWGLVDGQPTSKHFGTLVYDDVVTIDNVTPGMAAKTNSAWETSQNLGTDGGRVRYIGTRWHHNDTYRLIIERHAAIPRLHPATRNGKADGEPVLLSRETLAKKRNDMGPYTFGTQMLLDPTADRTQGFLDDWLRYYDAPQNFAGMNLYILVDPANEKKKDSDYTVIVVIALGSDENYYLVDAVRDRLSLSERADALFALHRRWRPRGVGYEHYGMQADIDYCKERMARENYRFEVSAVGGHVPKPDRIRRMVPVFEAGRFYLPQTLPKRDYEGRHVDLVASFINDEYRSFPVGLHDDFLDAIARIWDIPTIWPRPIVKDDRYGADRAPRRPRSAWAM